MYSNNIKPPNPDLSYYFSFRQTIIYAVNRGCTKIYIISYDNNYM